jgi:Penicillin V acylase and related amidases
MKCKPGAILKVIACIILICIIAFIGYYFTRIQTINTIEKLSSYEDGYDIYSMTVKYDYNSEDIINSNFDDTQEFIDAVINESLPFLPVHIDVPSFGCSAYCASLENGDTIMGRNYDFKIDTSALLVFCNPENGYKSMALAAMSNIGTSRVDTIANKMACLTAPFICLDGLNEKGVAIATLTLDSEPVNQHTGRQKIATSLAIRLVLDNAATTQEAVDLLRSYDMMAANGRDYHFFINDASGDSRVVEYDCESLKRELVDTPIEAITNFFGMYIDKVQSNQKNGIYGHGKERYDKVMAVIEPKNRVLTTNDAWKALMDASTEPNPDNVTSNTQWSLIYNNTKHTADITIRRHWGDVFSFGMN